MDNVHVLQDGLWMSIGCRSIYQKWVQVACKGRDLMELQGLQWSGWSFWLMEWKSVLLKAWGGKLIDRILANNVSPIRQELWCWEHTWPFPRIFLKYREDGKPSDCTSRLMQIKALCLPFKWSQKISVQFANILIKFAMLGSLKVDMQS